MVRIAAIARYTERLWNPMNKRTTSARVVSMPRNTKQQRTAETRDASQHQVRSNEPRGIDLQSQHRPAGQGRTTHLSLRPEIWQKNVSATEWLSTSTVHDLRNPLGAIYAAAEMLMDLDPALTQVQRLATNIFRAAGRMQELLADLNGVALGNTPTLEMCDIGEVIAAACKAARPGIDNRRVQIVIEVPEGIEVPLIRPRMQSVFVNLIANALEAMPTGGRLHIAAREAGICVLIEMEDTGPGIPHEIRERLFEPFVTAGKEGGLGLGLALSRQSVLDHGGNMWIEPATGARFVIRLPLNRARSSENVYMVAESSTSGDVSNW
jgi:signal transduction histidine kinase